MSQYLKNTKIIFYKLPKKSKILFYDHIPSKLVKDLIGSQKYSYIFNFANREIYLLFIFLIFIDFKAIRIFFSENLITSYTYLYIKFVNPKIIITSTDNNLNFYKLKKYFNNIKFVALQNGARHKINDIFGDEKIEYFLLEKEKSADVVFTFNTSISKYYEKYFKCKTIPIGKFINNNFKAINPNTFKKKILYISQYRPANFKKDYFISHDKKICTIKKWTEVDRKLLPLLSKFCSKNNIQLIILGAAKDDYYKKLEKKYFSLYVNSSNWSYWNKNTSSLKRYEFISKFEYIVCSWSTLGLEMFARNVKVAFFRQKNIPPYNDRNFGWPYPMTDKGFWYSNQISYLEVKRILNNLFRIKKSEWINKINHFKKKIMVYDEGNKKIKNFISNTYYD